MTEAEDIVDEVTDRTYRADAIRETLDGLNENTNEDVHGIDNFDETIESFVEQVVEQGTFIPDNSRVSAGLDLTMRERLSGRREQDMTAMLVIGMMLGTALERDVPSDTALENLWREGVFELPDEVDE